MTDRLNVIFNAIPNCNVFADIGCDHGYIAKAMLKSGKCKKVIVSDISAKCLSKAEELLKSEIDLGLAKSVVSDGFERVEGCDVALIAGMGGEEIRSILLNAKELPAKLILQPMKNCDKVRLCAVKLGYKIILDEVFKSLGKFYDLIVLERGEDFITLEEAEFGRDNVLHPGQAFKEMLGLRLDKLRAYSKNPELNEETRNEMLEEISKLEKYV